MTEQKTAPQFTSRVTVGNRTMFFEVQRTGADTLQLAIRTPQPSGNGRWKRESLTVQEHEVQEFCQAVADSASFLLNR